MNSNVSDYEYEQAAIAIEAKNQELSEKIFGKEPEYDPTPSYRYYMALDYRKTLIASAKIRGINLN